MDKKQEISKQPHPSDTMTGAGPKLVGIGFGLIVAATIGGLSAFQLSLAIAVLLGVIVISAAGFLFYRPARVLLVFLALLPVYQLTMVLFYKVAGSLTWLRLAQSWKEVLAIGTLLLVMGLMLLSSRWFKWQALDWLIAFYLGLNVAYLFGPWDTSFIARLYGVRANALLAILYFLGRLIPLSLQRQRQVLNGLLILGTLTGLAALVDHFLLPPDWPIRIGLMEYLGRETGEAVKTSAPFGLTWTFWTATGFRRVSAFFANPLDMAASFHLTGIAVLVVALYYPRRSKGRLLASGIFCLLVLALAMSISRAATMIFVVECLLIALLRRRRDLVVLILIGAALGLVGLLLTSPTMARFIQDTVTFQNPSSQGHLNAWFQGLRAMISSPLGYGPGTSSHVGARFGMMLGGENQYVVLGVELGIVGLLLYVSIQIVSIWTALRLFRHEAGVTQMLLLIAAVSRIGLAIAGLTAHIEIYFFQAFVSWWLIGFASQTRSASIQPFSCASALTQARPS